MQLTDQTRKLLTIFGCILLAIFLLVVCVWGNFMADSERCTGLENDRVEVIDEMNTGFVTSAELTADIMPRLGDLTARPLSQIGLDSIRTYLCSLDKIETASVMRLNNNRLRISVVPMVPVARVWPSSGPSYYINRQGKTIRANARYHLDVPQLRGDYPAVKLLPLLDYLNENPDISKLITLISARDSSNIFLVPAIRGHVINLGDISNIPDKFSRLEKFYAEVLPAKGWEHYDTISLKWNRQIVATRRHGKLPDLTVKVISELENEGPDLETISAPGASAPEAEQKSQSI